MTGSSSRPRCPVCAEHTPEQSFESAGIVITGIEATLGEDESLVQDLYRTLTPYDGHTAIAWCAELMLMMERLTGIAVHRQLAKYRSDLNEATGHL